LEQHKVSLSELQKQREAIAEKLNKARRTHAHIKTEYDQREQLQAQAAELRRLGNTRVLRVEISQLDGRLTEGTAMIAAAQDSLSKLKKSEAEADMRYRALREASLDLDSVLEAHLSQLTASLEDGKPCPVCGSLHHATHHLKHQEGKAKGTGSTKLLQARLAAAKENSKALKASEEALDLARKEGSKAEEALRKLESFHQELQQHRTTLQANLNAETGSYRLIDAKQFDQHSQDQLERLAADALNKYHGLGSLFQKEQERIDELLASQHKQEGMFQQVQSRQMDLMKKEATLVQQLQAALQSSDFEDLDTIASLLLEPLDVPEEKLAIERWTNQYNKAQLAVEQAEAQTSTITYDAEAHDELKTKARETSEALKQRLIEIGSLKQNIELLKKQLEEKKAIRKRHTALLRRADNLKLMRRLFTGSGFVNYVSAMYLRQLCQAANERFRKLTHNQLQLEPTEDNSFAVRDFLNDGQLRSHKTLSGGQVFQASLCLALALADQVQAREGSHQRFFFIDEGFGALDKNALKLVFEALRALRKEQRIVGIISHVEELQEDIDTYLHIENDGDTGSQVRPSWL
jgi:exonuclease SbcC